LIEAGYPWEDMVKSVEEFRNRQSDIPDQVADSVAGQNILVDLRISELLDTAAFRTPAAAARGVDSIVMPASENLHRSRQSRFRITPQCSNVHRPRDAKIEISSVC
jgi:hypothetical protein